VAEENAELLRQLVEEVRLLREETNALLRELLARLESIERSQYS
jgi:hypothetical protein